jgi:formyl-CoA transferase
MPVLDTMRVLDFTQWEAGPTATQYLAWMGADVVKLEAPSGDPGRRAFSTDGTDSQYFCNHNGNKRSVVLDLKSEEGRDLFLRMLARFDVLVENQGPGVMERFGLDEATLEEARPGLVYARVKGFGLSGPYSTFKAFDTLAIAASGVTSMTGTADTGPLSPGGTFGDTGTGIHTAFAITAAYAHQQRTGEGQVIEMSMHEVMTMFTRTLASTSWGPDAAPQPFRRSDGPAPGGRWRCKGDGPNDCVMVVIANPAMWQDFCAAVGRPELADDERFARGGARAANDAALREILEPWFADRTKQEVMEVLGEGGVPVSAVFDTTDVFNDPHLHARDFFTSYDHPTKGELLVMGPPFRMSGSTAPLTRAPLLGEHSRAVLSDELGLDGATIDDLVTRGVVKDG